MAPAVLLRATAVHRNASDAELALLLRGREPEALEEIYRRHQPAVAAVAGHLLSPCLRDEVVQDVFLKLWNAPDRFEPSRGRLIGFLKAEARYRSIDHIRSETARLRRESRYAAAGVVEQDLPAMVADQHAAQQLRVAVHRLPARERIAIELAFFGGHNYRRVAEMLDQPEGTIKSRIRAGLGRLRVVLVADGLGPAWPGAHPRGWVQQGPWDPPVGSSDPEKLLAGRGVR